MEHAKVENYSFLLNFNSKLTDNCSFSSDLCTVWGSEGCRYCDISESCMSVDDDCMDCPTFYSKIDSDITIAPGESKTFYYPEGSTFEITIERPLCLHLSAPLVSPLSTSSLSSSFSYYNHSVVTITNTSSSVTFFANNDGTTTIHYLFEKGMCHTGFTQKTVISVMEKCTMKMDPYVLVSTLTQNPTTVFELELSSMQVAINYPNKTVIL